MIFGLRSLARACAFISLLLPLAAQAQDKPKVTLRALDGGISVTGLLIAFDGANYEIATQLGTMAFAADQVLCEGAACPTPEAAPGAAGRLTLAIGDDLNPGLVPLLIESYAASTRSALVRSLDPSGNLSFRMDGAQQTEIATLPQQAGFAFNAMSQGRADITITQARPTADAVAVAALGPVGRLDDPANQHIIGLDALSVVVSAANTVRAITPAQIADIFSGRIANWSALGGPNAPIKPVITGVETGLGTRVAEAFLEGRSIVATAQFAETAAEVADRVAKDRYAIGITTYSNQRSAVALAIAGECGLRHRPTPAAIATETYPYTERVLAYSGAAGNSDAAAGLLEFLQKDAGQRALGDAGYVGQRVATLSLDAQGQRFIAAMQAHDSRATRTTFRALLEEVSMAERLTPTFRFVKGGAGLDQKAQSDVIRLARYISDRDLRGSELLFIGFTDDQGASARNRKLSVARAGAVRDQVLALLEPEQRESLATDVKGFGEIAPLACNDTARGQATNQRVEIWLRPKG